MHRSVAQGPDADPRPKPAGDWRDATWFTLGIGALLAVIALLVYASTRADRYYDHFVWQAAAFLEGNAAIRYPVDGIPGVSGNAEFQDVLPVATTDGVPRGLLPFPPLPALVLVPFVAAWGMTTDDQAIFTILAAIDVAICWWALGYLRVSRLIRAGTTVLLTFGTVFWFTAQTTTTWYQAHIVAMALTLLAIGVALRGDRVAPAEPTSHQTPSDVDGSDVAVVGWRSVEPRQFLAGLLFGLACTARLSIVVGAPFFAFVGPGGGWRRRAWSAGLGAAIPIVALVAYNVMTTGHVLHPAYDYLYALEASGYPALGYHTDWSVEDPRYLVQNLGIAVFGMPDVLPRTLPESIALQPTPVCVDPSIGRGLFSLACPLAVPRDTGMSVLLTTPAYLLAIPVVMRQPRSRLVIGAAIAIVGISLVNLMHFSQGWVQFGYRFSNDAAPFALPLVALGAQALAGRSRWGLPLAAGLLVASIAINLWGVTWSRLLGW